MPNQHRQIPAAERFFLKVAKTDACWLWTGAKFDNGYGAFRDADVKQVRAHRWSYEHHVGLIPDGLLIRHSCDVRACVNPAHLTPGTQKENQADMLARRRLGRRPITSKLNVRKAAKLTFERATEIRARYSRGGCTYASLGKDYGVAATTIQALINGRTWRD